MQNKLSTSWLTYKAVTIPAAGVLPVNVTGQMFVCKDASATFLMSFGDRSEFFPMEAGLGFRLAGDDQFNRVTFKNEGASAVTVSFYAGEGRIEDNRIGKINAAVYLTGYGGTSIAAGATVEFTGVNGSDLRKQIVVTNLDAAINLQVLDADDEVAASVFAGTAWTVEMGGMVKIKNPGGAPVTFNVGETWYDLG